MPSPTPDRPRLTDLKRQAILDAAAEAFREQGFEAAGMDRIAAQAGVSKRTVYNHFPSKEALFEAILQRLWTCSVAQLDGTYRPDVPLRDQLVALLGQKMRMLHEPAFLDLVRVLVAEFIHTPARAQEMLARMGGREEGLAFWIRGALKDGRLKPLDPAFAAQQLHGLVKGFAFWPQLTMGEPPLSKAMRTRVVESAADLFLAHYAAPVGRRPKAKLS